MSGWSGIIGDAESFADAAFGDGSQHHDAPVPAIQHGPPRPVEPARWHAPRGHAGGRITVHRDVLLQVARAMHHDVAGLDPLLSQVKASSGGLSSLTRWQTGSGFHANATNACDGFAGVGTQAADTLTAAAKALSDTASTYEEAESASHLAVKNVSAQLDASGGSVSSANGVLG